MRIHILGASGSGGTTQGQALAARLRLPYFDSDDYFWLQTEPPFRQRRDAAARNHLLRADLDQAGQWVLGGSVINWGEGVLPRFDLVVFLYLAPAVRLSRIRAREEARYGDSIYTDPGRAAQFEAFMAWAADYDAQTGIANRTLQAHRDWLAGLRSPVLELIGDLPTAVRVQRIVETLTADSCC
ncbi:MAG: adenylate kinase [Bacteroidia bacterium]